MAGENEEWVEHTTGVVREAKKEQAELLDGIFGTLASSGRADRALLRQNFSTPESERQTPHSPLLQKRGMKHLVDEPTVSEQIRIVLRRP